MGLLFVFDMDDVIVDYDWRHRMDGLTRLTGVPFGTLRERWWNVGGEGRAEAGEYADGSAYLAALNGALGTRITEDEFIANRGSAMTLRPDVVAALERAAGFGELTMLTNNGPLVGERLADLVPELVPLFGTDHLRASSRYGARKPDPAVFERMLAEYDQPAADTFFADDLSENVAGAASVGITAHLYRDAPSLVAAIDAFAAERGASVTSSVG